MALAALGVGMPNAAVFGPRGQKILTEPGSADTKGDEEEAHGAI